MNPLTSLAKSAVENYINDKKIISVPEKFPEKFLNRSAGVFVTIEKTPARNASHSDAGGGDLRGCIGTYLPARENIAEETIHNAISAATEDWRFGSIKKTELTYLTYTVSILSEPEPVSDISELDAKKFGIILKAGAKCGILLPDLEGVNTPAEQISICCQKGGIVLKNDNPAIYKFTVEKFND